MNKIEKNYVDLYDSVLRCHDQKYYGVQHFYANPSQNKIDIEKQILRKMFLENGYNYRLLSANKNVFTCGYLVNDKYDRTWLRVFTKTKMYKILLEE